MFWGVPEFWGGLGVLGCPRVLGGSGVLECPRVFEGVRWDFWVDFEDERRVPCRV